MLDRIIQFSLKNRLLVLLSTVVLIVCGLYTAFHAEVDVFPDLNAPTVVVMTEAQGMAADEVEKVVTFPIETAVNGATHVRRVRSSSTSGFSVVWVEFEWDTDIYLARQIVSEKLATIADAMPDGVGSPTLGPQSSVLGELLIVGLTSDSTSMLDLRTIADWTIRPRLLSTGGVAQVSVIGGDVKEYQIKLHPDKMKHFGITLSEVMEATEQMNRNTSGGVIYEHGNEYIVRANTTTNNVDKIASCVVKLSDDGTPITLAEISDVQIGSQLPLLGKASVRCKPAVLLTVTKQPHTGTTQLTDKLEEALEDIQKHLPSDVKVTTDIFRQSRFIDSAIGNVQRSLIEGGFFVAIILILFLANIRTTFISIITIPISLLTTILVLDFLGLTINTMSLGGMAIAIGSLVDDAIVDVENVWKHLRANRLLPIEQRQRTLQVVYEASKEVRLPILYSTLIIIVSFIPLFWLSGMEGKMLVPLGVAFITALCASTFVALTLTPVLCSFMLAKKYANAETKKKADSPVAAFLKHIYQKSLVFALDHKKSVIGLTIVIFCISIGLFATLGRSFLPPFNEGSLTINVNSMPGISLEESDRIGKIAESILLEIPEIQTVGRKTGRAELDEHALGVNMSEIEAPYELDGRSKQEFMDDVRRRLSVLPGVNIEIGQPISHRIDHMLSGTQANIAIKIFGDDLRKLYDLGNQIKAATADVEGVADLNVEQLVERPELSIVPKHEMLARHGISLAEFNKWIGVCLAGEVVSHVYEGDKIFNLVVRADEDTRTTAERIKDMTISNASGRMIPLSQVADIRSSYTPNTINRENVKRKIVVSANTSGRDLRSVVNDIKARIDEKLILPEGYHVQYGGQFESEAAASATLMVASLISVVVIFLLLYMQFHNAQQSAIILINLPLALIGGVIVLFFTTGETSIPAIIGFISLFGIATRNGMLLITQYNLLHDEGRLSPRECIIAGSVDRLNPILMTALTSALALIPLAINSDSPGNEIQSPMAKVILGGLITSTILNAYIVPVIQMIRMNRQNERERLENKA